MTSIRSRSISPRSETVRSPICADIARAVAAVAAAATATAATVGSQLTAYAAATTDADRVTALTAAAQALFGEPPVPAGVRAPGRSGPGLDRRGRGERRRRAHPIPDHDGGHLRPGAGVGHGAARVRPALHAWEIGGLLAPAFGRAEPALTPAQLPYTAGDPWLAMQFPAELHDQQRPAAVHGVLRAGLRRDGRVSAACSWTSGPRSSPPRPATRASRSTSSRPDNEPPQAILVVTPGHRRRGVALGRPRRRAVRDARPGQDPGGRASRQPTRRRTRGCCRPRSWRSRCTASRSPRRWRPRTA